jgi:phosphate butyryltransferase
MGTFEQIKNSARESGIKKIAVPKASADDLKILARAGEEKLIKPVLIGERGRMEKLAKNHFPPGLEYEIEDSPGGELKAAISMLKEGRADVLMRGAFEPKAFSRAVLDPKTGLMKNKVASHALVVQLMKSEKLIIVTDTFVNNFPGITEKQQITDQALTLAGKLGIDCPKVAALAAIEGVNPSIPSTLDAALLSKMAERKQFGKALIEGPLDIDCALSRSAADRKGVKSMVTGNVDIYLVPEVETGYLLAQTLVFFGKMKAAGIMLGMIKPVVLNLPFIPEEGRLAEIALASLLSCK